MKDDINSEEIKTSTFNLLDQIKKITNIKTDLNLNIDKNKTESEYVLYYPDGKIFGELYVTGKLTPNIKNKIKIIKNILENNILTQYRYIKTNDKFNHFFNNTIEGIFRIDPKGNYVFLNDTYADIYGYTKEEMLKPGFDVYKTWIIEEEIKLLLDEAKKKPIEGIIINFKKKNGSYGKLELHIQARFESEGFLGYDGFAKDITERHQSIKAEIEARRRAEFLVDLMSHDINNINQGLLMLLEHLRGEEELTQNHRVPIKLAIEQVNYATELIKNVKKLQTVLEEPIELTQVKIGNIIDLAAEAAKGAFPKKKLEVSFDESVKNTKVLADDFLKDLFFNLFHNSMKHSDGDNVRIDVGVYPADISENVEIHVCDYGSGIPDEEKKRILQRRLGAKGSGIGLTIVNYLLDRYNGDIRIQDRVENKPSNGSRFIIVLPRGDSN
ncbi:PAS domain S-box protein [Candidatus Bathyarchaeota archaeon]|nr:PAS domain S-box protein [Candidatus Bathyarchaeota archaeon]